MIRPVHVHHQFHAVGHGTFFTGVVSDARGTGFRLIYDCGSKRVTRIEAAIDALGSRAFWSPGLTVDLMAVSHFDDDHVNGLEGFLTRYRVKWLVLPYMGLKQRLAHAASLEADDVSSAATASFALDPIGYLAARGLADRVDALLLIQGGDGDGAGDAGSALPDPNGPEDLEGMRFDRGIDEQSALAYRLHPGLGTKSSGGPQIRLQSHSRPIVADSMPMKFAFFNVALPDGEANRSKQPLAIVAEEVSAILEKFGVLDLLHTPRRGWRDQLKACYLRHFGSSGLERNNISLCVLVRPLAASSTIEPCGWFREPTGGDGTRTDVSIDVRRQALLLTGDLTLNGDVIGAMRAHFRNWRWQQLDVAQVPHHGSVHSWARGNAAMFPGPQFVHCVPTTPGKVPHPHPSVVADLVGSRVHQADYDQSVVQTYHFEG